LVFPFFSVDEKNGACDGEVDEFETLFNIQYLLEGVSHMKGDSCDVSFGGISDPVKIGPVGREGKYLYLVMPIQD